MPVYTPLVGATVEAFQWRGDPLSDYAVPGWAIGLHAPSDQTLHVPCWNGSFGAKIGDWIVRGPTGDVNVVSNATFAASYNVDEIAVDETKKTAEESRALAAEARAAADEQRAKSAVATHEAKMHELRAASRHSGRKE